MANSGLAVIPGDMWCSVCIRHFSEIDRRLKTPVEEENKVERSSSVCSVGQFEEEECLGDLMALSGLPQEEQELVLWRSNLQSQLQITEEAVICNKHIGKYLLWYSQNRKFCCDIFKLHTKGTRAVLREITLEEAKKMANSGLAVIPGDMWCSVCIRHFSEIYRRHKTPVEEINEMEVCNPVCCLGKFSEEECSGDLKALSKLSQEEKELFLWRSNHQSQIEITGKDFVCNKHIRKYLLWYSLNRKSCCDILKFHTTNTRADLLEITLEEAKIITNSGLAVVPGEKMCLVCRRQFNEVCRSEDAINDEMHIMDGIRSVCFVGKIREENCSPQLKAWSELTEEEQELILWRINVQSQIQITDETAICHKHISKYLLWYSRNRKFCCDVFKCHPKIINKDLREITLKIAKKMRNSGLAVTPGEMICCDCRVHFVKEYRRYKENKVEGSSSVCSVGQFEEEECLGDLMALSGLPQEEQELVLWRSNLQSQLQITEVAVICNKHIGKYLLWYSLNRKFCCNVFNLHSRIIRAALQEITLEEAKKMANSGLAVIPGDMWCSVCIRHLSEIDRRLKTPVEEVNKLEESSSVCTFGRYMEEKCSNNLKALSELTEEEQEIILWRCNLQSMIHKMDEAIICERHVNIYLFRFSVCKTFCCDIFKVHKHLSKSGLKVVTLEEAKKLRDCGFEVIPGDKVCSTCSKRISKVCGGLSTASESSMSPRSVEEEVKVSSDLTPESPSAKVHSTDSRTQMPSVKLRKELSALQIDICEVCGSAKDTKDQDNDEDMEEKAEYFMEEKAEYFDVLMGRIKEKIKFITLPEKIQLLTVVPVSWSVGKVCEMFGVSGKLVRRARALLANKGILALPAKQLKRKTVSKTAVKERIGKNSGDGSSRKSPRKKRKTLSRDTVERESGISTDMESSSEMPGHRNEELAASDVHLHFLTALTGGGLDQLQSTSAFTFVPVKEEPFECCDLPPEAAGSQDFLEAECVLKEENGWTSLDA